MSKMLNKKLFTDLTNKQEFPNKHVYHLMK